MTLTAPQFRSRSASCNGALVAQITIPPLTAVQSQIRFPTSDVLKTYIQYSSGTNAWALTDDDPPDELTTYIWFYSTAGFVAFGSSAFTIPAGATVLSVTVYQRCRMATGQDDGSVKGVLKVNGSYYTHTDAKVVTEASWETTSETWDTNPDTGLAWTAEDVNGIGDNPLEPFGLECETIPTSSNLRITQVYCKAHYVEPSTVYHFGDYTDPIQISGVHVNPLLKGIDGLDAGDFSQVSDLTLRFANRKEQTQAKNPLVEPVKMTDLIAEGLGRASVTVKEAILGIQNRTITSWDSSDLVTVFVGTVRTPFDYDEESFTLSATCLEMEADEEIPDERVGEASAASPEGDTTLIPIHVGNNSPWQDYWGSRDIAGLADDVKIGRALDGVEAPLYKFPSDQSGKEATYVASGRAMDTVSDVLVNLGMPNPCVMPQRYGDTEQYATRQADGRQYIDLRTVSRFYVYYPERMAADPAVLNLPMSEDWKPLAKEYGEVSLAAGDTIAVGINTSTPSIPTILAALLFYVRIISAPPNSQLQAEIQFYSRDGSKAFTLYTRAFWLSEVQAGGLWTSKANWVTALGNLRHESPYWDDAYGDTEWADDKLWDLFGSTDGLRLYLKRTDTEAGDIIIGGVYSLPFFRCFDSAVKHGLFLPRIAPKAAEKPEEMAVLTGGDGVATGAYESTTLQAHPRHIYHYLLTEELGKDPSEVDIEARSEFLDTVNWRLGFGLTSTRPGRQLLGDLQEQSTMVLVKDTDGVYRLRLKARGGALPAWQRFGYTLEPDVDALNIKVSQPGADYVKNAITVKYQNGRRTAWVTPDSSGDGYGSALPEWEAVAAASKAKYGLRRWDIDAWAVHDSVTAVGILTYYLGRRSEIPNVVKFNMPKLGAYLHAGQYVDFLASAMDAKFLLGGATWNGKYFQVNKKGRWGDRWQFTATQVPAIEMPEVIMIVRPVMMSTGT